jgi:hypothetical protein
MQKMTKKIAYSVIAVVMVLSLVSCEQEKEFAYNIDYLIDNRWGIPRIQEGGSGFDKSHPVVFHKDGHVTFGGRTDFWQVRGSRSLLIQERSQIWQVLELTENKFHVEVLKHPNGKFIANVIYYPAE